MGLEDTVQQQAEQLLQRIRDLGESEIRAFVSDVLTSAAKERASVLDETRRFAEDEQGRAVRDESARTILFDLDSAVQAVAGDRGQDDAAVVQLTGVYHNLLRRWADA